MTSPIEEIIIENHSGHALSLCDHMLDAARRFGTPLKVVWSSCNGRCNRWVYVVMGESW